MAKPRVFISSTFFDLRQVRADLERFIKDLGYDCVRNETGGIPYGKDQKLEEYCYKEISEIDILVGIVGGRFGTEAERGDYSITQIEIKTAIEQSKQVYIFIEKNVLAEYETYLINKDNDAVKYRFVEDKRIYQFIEEIYLLPKNNIVQPFETALEITYFLREQWAGLFRDLLYQETRKAQYENISLKVNELTEVAATLQIYLENVLTNVGKEKNETENLITSQKKRLESAILTQRVKELPYIDHLISSHEIKINTIIDLLHSTNTYLDFMSGVEQNIIDPPIGCIRDIDAFEEVNKARKILSLLEYELNDEVEKELDNSPFSKKIISKKRTRK
ncbi:hypothetical protein FNO01nite_34760 [Flavobacterium noncentrifugens]|uniref:DUF4062 domain-containing protein n=1 Tax=Flavobacterium noncentrifugens TaxID=1128970 RepID=A0A1G9DFW0_9FLAO|nr:DUF4062 domain-containing protein [Flavobacterium noncentrifugens]GEP52804.1 hypothetical protein FNO01nite_34760 [Flavobacterium noncentrifugens]SDK62765.1 protein of unknown function [Flavobacterium noncentrifugens]